MYLVLSLTLVSLTLISLLNLVSSLCGERVVLSREELSAYECGFEHHNVSRVPFSIRFFMLTLLFLLFDLEVVFLLFLPPLSFTGSSLFCLLVSFLFLLFLYLSLLYEWSDGTLEWLV